MKHFQKKTSFFILAGFVIFLLIFIFKVKEEMVDFEVNYKAGKRIGWGETLYRAEDGHYQFKYSPFSAILYWPLSYLPLTLAKAIWYFLILFSVVLIGYSCRRLIGLSKDSSIWISVLPFLILTKYFLRELDLGQINALITLILLLMVGYLVSDEREKSRWKEIYAGGMWGFALALKPYALIFLPYFIIKKKWKALTSGLFFLSVALLLPSLFYGFKGNLFVLKEWKRSLSQSTPTLLDTWDNSSIIAFFMKWTGDQKTSLIFAGAVFVALGILCLIVFLKGGKERAPVLDGALILILIPLISPLGWDYNFLMSVLGIMILLAKFKEFTSFWKAVLIFNFSIITFALYDILGREYYGTFMSLSITTINFLIIIGFLAYLRLRKRVSSEI
ncbi:glycosyltransferase family 87 protein [Acidobacteriota bacterium]